MSSREVYRTRNSDVGDASLGHYVFASSGSYGENRYRLLSEIYDPGTFYHLQSVGLRLGWRCLEAGAGGGSVAAWLARRVGTKGQVVATDVDISLLSKVHCRNLQIQQHNLVNDPIPEQAFDLVHTRLVLMHLPEREQALSKLIRAVKPQGWIVLEEFDSLSVPAHSSRQHGEETLKSNAAFRQYMLSRGVDLGYGRKLAFSMHSMGLESVRAEGSLSMWQGGSLGARFIRSTCQELREELLRTGAVSEQELDHDLWRLDDSNCFWPSPILWTVVGRRSDIRH